MNYSGIKRVQPRKRPFFSRLIYSDGKILTSQTHALRGRPDFIYENVLTRRLAPMELKSGIIGDAPPHYGDVMQLAAYFLIVEDAMGKRPRRGFLRYRDAMFVVKNSARRRKEVLAVMADMRHMLESGVGEANPSFVHCRYCIARDSVCEFAK